MNRRDLLRWSAGPGRVLELSCEALYMNFLDSRIHGTSGHFLERVLKQLRSANTVRLLGAFWLDRAELKETLEPHLTDLRSRGVLVEYR